MSHDCGNPDCPSHGNSQRAIDVRRARQAVITNPELMTLVRTIASNVHVALSLELAKRGLPMRPNFLKDQFNIVFGDKDSDAVVQGVVDGLSTLHIDYEPIQQLAATCASLPEDKQYLQFILRQTEKDTNEDLQKIFPGAPPVKFHSLEEMRKFMKGAL